MASNGPAATAGVTVPLMGEVNEDMTPDTVELGFGSGRRDPERIGDGGICDRLTQVPL